MVIGAVCLDAGQQLAAVGGKHAVAVAMEPEWRGAGGADDAVGFEGYFGCGELGGAAYGQ